MHILLFIYLFINSLIHLKTQNRYFTTSQLKQQQRVFSTFALNLLIIFLLYYCYELRVNVCKAIVIKEMIDIFKYFVSINIYLKNSSTWYYYMEQKKFYNYKDIV